MKFWSKICITITFLMTVFVLTDRYALAEESYPVIFESIQRVVLSAQRAGVLSRFKCEEGAAVKKGSLICGIDDSELKLKKNRNAIALKHLEAQLRDLIKLSQRGLATKDNLSKSEMERDITRAELKIIKHQISNSAIRAPFKGIVIRLHAKAYEWVTIGQPVAEMINPHLLRAVANIPSSIAVTLKPESKHEFYIHDLEMSISGTVKTIVPAVDELSNTARVIWKVVKGNKTILAGMKGEVKIGP